MILDSRYENGICRRSPPGSLDRRIEDGWTCQQDVTIRQQLIEHLMREIMRYDAEFAVRMQLPFYARRPCT